MCNTGRHYKSELKIIFLPEKIIKYRALYKMSTESSDIQKKAVADTAATATSAAMSSVATAMDPSMMVVDTVLKAFNDLPPEQKKKVVDTLALPHERYNELLKVGTTRANEFSAQLVESLKDEEKAEKLRDILGENVLRAIKTHIEVMRSYREEAQSAAPEMADAAGKTLHRVAQIPGDILSGAIKGIEKVLGKFYQGGEQEDNISKMDIYGGELLENIEGGGIEKGVKKAVSMPIKGVTKVSRGLVTGVAKGLEDTPIGTVGRKLKERVKKRTTGGFENPVFQATCMEVAMLVLVIIFMTALVFWVMRGDYRKKSNKFSSVDKVMFASGTMIIVISLYKYLAI